LKIGLFPNHDQHANKRAWLQALGVAADEGGFHSIWFPEHVVLFEGMTSESPYRKEPLPVGEGIGSMDPVACIAFLAATTHRVRLGTGICILPQHQPVFLAKEAATIDVLSDGRLDLGVGVG
jgi:alkanesulfonate monooxygenase SsuD/methylene tetrahydromethanopterin reductase-like flavin-dependent oxidoreductase (luciferase family)